MQKDTRINFDQQTLVKVLQGETYTVSEGVVVPSPTGISSGVSPTTIFNSVRATVGGAIFAGFSDMPGPSQPDDIHFIIGPNDVIAVSAIVLGVATVTINGETVATIQATNVAGVLLFWS